jgi:hypothetical protein
MPSAMKMAARKITRLSAAIWAVAALALVSFAGSGCGKLVPSMHFGGADAAADAPKASADGGSGPDTRAMDAPVDVAAEVRPSDAGAADVRDASDAGPADVRDASDGDADADADTVVDASTPDAPTPGDAGAAW